MPIIEKEKKNLLSSKCFILFEMTCYVTKTTKKNIIIFLLNLKDLSGFKLNLVLISFL